MQGKYDIEPSASLILQQDLGNVSHSHRTLTAKFASSVLGTLNWTISQWITILQELDAHSTKPELVYVAARQLSLCAAMFDHTCALLRLIEMLATVAPSLFAAPHAGDASQPGCLMADVCQVLCHLFSRLTPPCTFSRISHQGLGALALLQPLPLVSAGAGLLLALLGPDVRRKDEPHFQFPRFRALISQDNFKLDNFVALLDGKPEACSGGGEDQRDFVLSQHEEVSSQEMTSVRLVLELLSHCLAHQPSPSTGDEGFPECSICCDKKAILTLLPCQHTCCAKCVHKHLMSQTTCFFCTITITNIRNEVTQEVKPVDKYTSYMASSNRGTNASIISIEADPETLDLSGAILNAGTVMQEEEEVWFDSHNYPDE